jgi:hypothetical protein
VTVTLTASNGATPNPAGPFTGTTDAAGQFTVTFTSPTAGQVVGHACAVTSVGTVCTNGVAPNSGDATKTFVDANISIAPLEATNPVNTNHTLTATVLINDGSGAGFVPAPDNTLITFSLTNSNGATATFVGGNTCNTSGGTGSCSVQINSPTAGDTTISATTSVIVGGVTLVRTTGDGLHNDGPNAIKHWQGAFTGCTPGFFKQPQHFDSWVGFTQSQLVSSVFTVPANYTLNGQNLGSFTLLQALSFKGGNTLSGAAQTLLRAAVAAILNSTAQTYPLTTAQIVAEVNTALASQNRATILAEATRLDQFNNAPCTLS